MQAMVLKNLRTALQWTDLPHRQPGPGEIRVKVAACGVCRTDLHVVDGELPNPKVPIIPGHEIVGRIDAIGAGVEELHVGERVGIPWLGHTCGVCPYCRGGHENLCDRPLFTGYTRDGGFATTTIADARFAFPLGEVGSEVALTPLLCAGLIDRRRWQKAGALRLWCCGPYRGAGREVAGVIRIRLHAAGRRCHPGIRPAPRRDMGGRIRRDAAGIA
jgi:propanol-preferring alcohol dehydrogenase